MRAVLIGGGSAGHINPAIAIALCIKGHQSDSSILFLGVENGMEAHLVPKAGFPIEFIDVRRLERKITIRNILTAYKALTAFHKSKKILREFAPDIVIGTGGFVCGPVLRAAVSLNIPTIIHEQNVPPGLVVRMLASKVDATAISFEETRGLLPGPKRVVLTGNPIRQSILSVHSSTKDRKKPLVMVTGGSLGAARINDAVLELLEMEGQEYYDLTASVGERYYDEFIKELNARKIRLADGKKVLSYIYDMDRELSAADIVVSRAGAIAISEFCAVGKPAILIPSPNVAGDHQSKNAALMADAGAAVTIREEELCGKKLAEVIAQLLNNPSELNKMRIAAKGLSIRDADEKIYSLAMEFIDR